VPPEFCSRYHLIDFKELHCFNVIRDNPASMDDGADLGGRGLGETQMGETHMGEMNVGETCLGETGLEEMDMGERDLGETDLGERDLIETNLGETHLGERGLDSTDLRVAKSRDWNLGVASSEPLGSAELNCFFQYFAAREELLGLMDAHIAAKKSPKKR
jgi:hypothetical protein